MPEVIQAIHLSDLHIGRSKKERRRATRIFNWVAEHHAGVPVLITGDITHSGTRRHCEIALEALQQLAETNPVLTVPGNHDYGFLGLAFQQKSWKNYYHFLASPLGWPKSATWEWLSLESRTFLGVLEHQDIAYFGLDSCDPTDHEACARGWISKDLASRLQAELRKEKYKGKTRLLMLHHHPFEGSLLTALQGSKRLMQAIEGRCDVMIFGHEHHCGVWWQEYGIDLIVGSHKSTNLLFGDSLGLGLTEIRDPGSPATQIDYELEALAA